MADTERLENYDRLREERDWSHETMADHLEPLEPRLAADYRAAFCKREEKPKGRRSAAKSEA